MGTSISRASPKLLLASRDTAAKQVEARDDSELLLSANKGDEAATRELLNRYAKRLFGVVEAAHRDLGITEDIVQETFIRAIDRAHQLRDGQSLFPWLVRIGLRLALDQRRKRRFEWIGSPKVERSDPLEPTPDQRVEAVEDQQRVKAAMAKLKDQHRQLLILRYFESFSVAELASVFNKSEVAIRKDLQRARAKLRDQLGDWFQD